MKDYEATGTVCLPAGRVRLTPEQYKPRAFAVRPTEAKGVYELAQPIEFKRGEVFGYAGAVDKVLAMHMSERGGNARAPARKAEALL